MGKSPQEMAEAIIKNLPEKTGKPLSEWLELVRSDGPPTKKERVKWLKTEQGLGHVTAQILAARADEDAAKGDDYNDAAGMLDGMYTGAKEPLRRIYDHLLKRAETEIGPFKTIVCKTYVGLSAKKQFAVIQPTTKDRVDLGLALGDSPEEGRLRKAGSVGGSRISHAIALRSEEDIDASVFDFLRDAYEQNS